MLCLTSAIEAYPRLLTFSSRLILLQTPAIRVNSGEPERPLLVLVPALTFALAFAALAPQSRLCPLEGTQQLSLMHNNGKGKAAYHTKTQPNTFSIFSLPLSLVVFSAGCKLRALRSNSSDCLPNIASTSKASPNLPLRSSQCSLQIHMTNNIMDHSLQINGLASLAGHM